MRTVDLFRIELLVVVDVGPAHAEGGCYDTYMDTVKNFYGLAR